MDDAPFPPMRIIAESLRERCCVRFGADELIAAAGLPAWAPMRVPSSAWAPLISASRATGSSVR